MSGSKIYLPHLRASRPVNRRPRADERETPQDEPCYHAPLARCAPGGCGTLLSREEAKLPPRIIAGSGYRYEAGRCLLCRRTGR